MDVILPWPLSIACTLAHNKKNHKKTRKRMHCLHPTTKIKKIQEDKKEDDGCKEKGTN
jgi:hypothetical protein